MNLKFSKTPQNTRSSKTASNSPINSSNKFISYHSASRQQNVASSNKTSRLNSKQLSAAKDKLNITVSDPTRLPIILFGLVLILCLIYTTFLSTSAKLIVTKSKNSPELRTKQSYQQALDKLMSSNILYRNKLTIDTNKLNKSLLEKFPELQTANIVLPFMGHRPVVEVTTRKPAIILNSKGSQYVVDYSGRVIADISELPQGTVLDVPIVEDKSELDLRVGKAALSAQDVTFITTLENQFKAKGVAVGQMTLPPLAAELEVKFKDHKYYAKFSLLSDPRISAGQYIALTNELAAKKITPKEYIDARIEERLFFK